MTNRKSHTRFRLVPKSTTLDDLEGPYALCFKTHASFGTHHENLNEDRPILSATKIQPNDSRFWQYKVYPNIRGGSLKRERHRPQQWGNRKRVFRAFGVGRYVFGTLGNEVNIIHSFIYFTEHKQYNMN